MKLHTIYNALKSCQSIRTHPSYVLNASPFIIKHHVTSYLILTRNYADYITVKVPPMADSISEGSLKTWHKKVGDFVRADEEVATIETDKIDVAVNSPQSGIVVEIFSNEEDTVTVAGDLFKLELKSQDEGASVPPKMMESPPPPTAPVVPAHNATPVKETKTNPAPAKPASTAPVNRTVSHTTAAVTGRIEEREKLSRMRMRISDRLKESQNTLASLTTFNEVDMTNLIEFRNAYKDAIMKSDGIKFGYMSMFAKAVCYGVKHVPVINARIESNEVVYPNFVDISVAVSTEKGLVTPVVRNVHTMSLLGIEQAMHTLATKAKLNQLAIEDMAGGTFTISNGGVFGSMFGTPIINMPQSAILGMHAVKNRPYVVDNSVVIRPIMYICLTYDHRLIDGRDAVTFLVKVKQAIEDPRCLLL